MHDVCRRAAQADCIQLCSISAVLCLIAYPDALHAVALVERLAEPLLRTKRHSEEAAIWCNQGCRKRNDLNLAGSHNMFCGIQLSPLCPARQHVISF